MLVSKCSSHPNAGTSIHGRCNECGKEVAKSTSLENRRKARIAERT